MRRLSFNDRWFVRPKVNRFAELFGETPEWEPATLPHDAMITGERSPSAGAANGYFHGGNWEYRRSLDVSNGDAASGDAGVRGGLPRRGGVA